ncbi:MAG TPA: hypothetical protein VF143_12790 [Candidatus Nanopelagicales bacterium]
MTPTASPARFPSVAAAPSYEAQRRAGAQPCFDRASLPALIEGIEPDVWLPEPSRARS